VRVPGPTHLAIEHGLAIEFDVNGRGEFGERLYTFPRRDTSLVSFWPYIRQRPKSVHLQFEASRADVSSAGVHGGKANLVPTCQIEVSSKR